jgi:CheY-like chemotaxis protein
MTSKRILIVDDDQAHLFSTRDILLAEGYEVFTHTHGFGVTNRARELKPNLILLDVNMPGLSGEKLAELMKANYTTRELPIVFYSSNDEDSLRQAVKRYGAKGYISKGSVTALRARVAQYLVTSDQSLVTSNQ